MFLQQQNKTHSLLHLFRKGAVFRTRWRYLNVPCIMYQKQPRSYLLLQLLLNYCTYQRRRLQRASTKSKHEADIWFWKISNIQTQTGITFFCNASLMFEKFSRETDIYHIWTKCLQKHWLRISETRTSLIRNVGCQTSRGNCLSFIVCSDPFLSVLPQWKCSWATLNKLPRLPSSMYSSAFSISNLAVIIRIAFTYYLMTSFEGHRKGQPSLMLHVSFMVTCCWLK